jgi:hypothetical protein
MTLFPTALLLLYGGVLWSGELQGLIIHKTVPIPIMASNWSPEWEWACNRGAPTRPRDKRPRLQAPPTTAIHGSTGSPSSRSPFGSCGAHQNLNPRVVCGGPHARDCSILMRTNLLELFQVRKILRCFRAPHLRRQHASD